MKKKSNDLLQPIAMFITICFFGCLIYSFILNGNPNKSKAVSYYKKVHSSKVTPAKRELTNCKVKKCIALTFDDGPGLYEKQIVKILKKYKAHATFFMIGGAVKKRQKSVRYIYKNGNEIGNHTWDHRDLALLSKKKIKWEISSTNNVIKKYGGVPNVTLLRPPYGAYNKKVQKIAKKKNMAIIDWDIDTDDWLYKSKAHTVKVVLSNAGRNRIVLMHSIYSSTKNALPKILHKLKRKGFAFVTISELYGGKLKPGKVYN